MILRLLFDLVGSPFHLLHRRRHRPPPPLPHLQLQLNLLLAPVLNPLSHLLHHLWRPYYFALMHFRVIHDDFRVQWMSTLLRNLDPQLSVWALSTLLIIVSELMRAELMMQILRSIVAGFVIKLFVLTLAMTTRT